MGRSPCCEKEQTNKGAWSKEEDERLVAHIRTHGEGCWRSLPKAAGLLRCGKSCRLRWINYLRPDLKRGNFTDDDDRLIIKLHSLLGNKWSLIAGRLPGRTDNEIKNYWNTHIRRKLLSRGIDPATHRAVSAISFDHNKKSEKSSRSSSPSGSEESSPSWKQQQQRVPLIRAPDLNLELRISQPFQESHDAADIQSKGMLCFVCSFDFSSSRNKECKCNISGGGFLGLTTGPLDYRSV